MGQELGVGCWLLGGPRSHLLFSDEGTRVQAGVTLSQGDPLGLWKSNPRWNLVKGLEEAGEEVTGSPQVAGESQGGGARPTLPICSPSTRSSCFNTHLS